MGKILLLLVNKSLDYALEVVKNEVTRLDHSMEKAGKKIFIEYSSRNGCRFL